MKRQIYTKQDTAGCSVSGNKLSLSCHYNYFRREYFITIPNACLYEIS
jgi:hypothetical protein